MHFVTKIHCPFITPILFRRTRHYFKNMECVDLQPPKLVKGMLELDRSQFKKTINIPKLNISNVDSINLVMPYVKKLILKMERLKPVQGDENRKQILLHPLAVKSWDDLPKEELEKVGLSENDFIWEELVLHYDNWQTNEILKAVLPAEQECVTSFSRVGHILHLNLRDHLLPYKKLIAHVLIDKVAGCRTVVNKAQSIDNTYRNFQLELLHGDADYQVQVKEHGIIFEFDFSTVYWNPRLSTEHEKIVNMLNQGDVLLDCFAGVGPFAVPAAAKKKCHVLANDLNPESYKWLVHNAKKNRCDKLVRTFNKDAHDFIREDIKQELIRLFENQEFNKKIHIPMNLPAMAVEFLGNFVGILKGTNVEIPNEAYPLVHVYCFAKGGDSAQIARDLVESNLGLSLDDSTLKEIAFVRNVAPNKDMMRVSFFLLKSILFFPMETEEVDEAPPQKKQCNSNNIPNIS